MSKQKVAVKNSYSVPGLEKGIRLFELLADSQAPLGLSDMSRLLGINKHMLLRLLGTYVEKGWVAEVEAGPKYRLTLLPFHHASKPIAGSNLIQYSALPVKTLSSEASESASLAILDDDRMLFVLHYDGNRQVLFTGHVGGRYPMHCSAAGKMLLAHAPISLIDRLLEEGLKRMVPNTITTRGRLLDELERIRERGYALDMEEYAHGLMCFAGPIYDHESKVVAALNVSVLCAQYSKESLINDIGSKVLETCREISKRMGHDDKTQSRE